MFGKFFNQFLLNIFAYGFGSLFLGIPVFIYWLLTDYLLLGIGALCLFFVVVGSFTYRDLVEATEKEYKSEIKRIADDAQNRIATEEQKTKMAEHKESLWRESLKERASGFPSLFTNIAYYEKLIDDELAGYLRHKPHPAVSASETVKAEASRRRDAEYAQRVTQSLIEYYENIAPFLADFKDEIMDEDAPLTQEYTQEEKDDPVSNYLTKDEYKKLSSADRNQMALDRYWKRPKSKWLIGRIYERYVGYIYEIQGYTVEYTGIFKGHEDLGRDLICQKGKEIVVIQCKHWSQFKTIYEKHIFQFFGTVFQYRDANPNKNVKAVFYTSTELSDLARRFADELNIVLKEKFKMQTNYPCIKCNISQIDGTKIYHLPFDQQYDNTKIETKNGEFYASTVREAEDSGFRRAYRWHSNNE